MNKQLASLLFYNETLYTLPKVKVEDEPAKEIVFKKPVVLFTEVLSQNETELLGKILVAVKLKIADVEICSDSSHLTAVKKAKNVFQIVVFGNFMEAKKMPETYKVLNVGKQKYLFSDTMSVIDANKNGEKLKLWEALKEMFL